MSAKAMKVAKALINDEEHFSQICDTSAKAIEARG
jgi:hypothetical protein